MTNAQLVPTIESYKSALKNLSPLPFHHAAIILFHYRRNGVATATELADDMQYKSYRAINLHYGKFAASLCDELGLQRNFWAILDGAEPNDENGQLELVMRQEFVAALESLALVTKD